MDLKQAEQMRDKIANFFDINLGSKVDLVSKGEGTIYKDPLGVSVISRPNDVGHNQYDAVPEQKDWVQEIHFQNGSPVEGINGVSNEAIIATVLHRIVKQNESFPSPYNVLAILCLQTALTALQNRVKHREELGIYGSDKVEPDNEEEALVSVSTGIIHSLGLLSDLVIKFDSAYGLNARGKIHALLNKLASRIKDEEDEINLVTAFTAIAAAAAGSGASIAWAVENKNMMEALKQTEAGNGDGDNSSGKST